MKGWGSTEVCLGPLLFLIFINDLDEGINSNILKFADDTKIFKEVRNSIDCNQLQADLDKLVLWTQKWQMEFNVNTCKVMHVGGRDDNSTYYMEASGLTKISCEKDLGVWISADMKCSKQCMHAFNTVTRVFGMINWLPVRRRVFFKSAVIAWKCVNGVAPAYLRELCVCLLYTSPSPRDRTRSRMPSSA